MKILEARIYVTNKLLAVAGELFGDNNLYVNSSKSYVKASYYSSGNFINISRKLARKNVEINMTIAIKPTISFQKVVIKDLDAMYTERPYMIRDDKDIALYTYNTDTTTEELDKAVEEIKAKIIEYIDEAKKVRSY